MEGGLAIITSAERSQSTRHEFYTDYTENKDFVFVTRNGHEWLTRLLPIENDEVEALLDKAQLVRPQKVLDAE